MSACYIYLMIMVLTIPMFVRGKIGIDALQNLETCTRDEDCDSSKLCTNGMCVIAGCNEECN
ncbi:hypothetical protein PV326_008258, partial [Microctonus aethiopoides]